MRGTQTKAAVPACAAAPIGEIPAEQSDTTLGALWSMHPVPMRGRRPL